MNHMSSHELENGINFLNSKYLRSDGMVHYSSLELLQIHHIVFVHIRLLEHFSYCIGQINLVIFSFSDLNENCHDLIQFIQGYDLVTVCIKKIENSNQILLEVSSAKHVEQNEHVRHGNSLIFVGHIPG